MNRGGFFIVTPADRASRTAQPFSALRSRKKSAWTPGQIHETREIFLWNYAFENFHGESAGDRERWTAVANTYSRGKEKLLAFNSDKLMPANVCAVYFRSVALCQNLEKLIESKINLGKLYTTVILDTI